jgi:DNA-binding MarR family transcriptional regulator
MMFELDKIDKLIHERTRLSILSLLAGRDDWGFQDLKTELELTDGNLITHIRKLMEAGYVNETREETSSRQRTTYQMTDAGREAFRGYISLLESIVKFNQAD